MLSRLEWASPKASPWTPPTPKSAPGGRPRTPWLSPVGAAPPAQRSVWAGPAVTQLQRAILAKVPVCALAARLSCRLSWGCFSWLSCRHPLQTASHASPRLPRLLRQQVGIFSMTVVSCLLPPTSLKEAVAQGLKAFSRLLPRRRGRRCAWDPPYRSAWPRTVVA